MTAVLLAEKPTQVQIQTNDTKKEPMNKAESKREFFKNLEWKAFKKTALACITYPLSEKNHLTLLQEIMPGLLEQNIKLAFMGIGTQKYQDYFTQLNRNHPDQIVILEEDEKNKANLYNAADVLICPSTSPDAQAAIKQALANNVVPIALSQSGLMNYDPVQECGNAFVFNQLSPWSLFASIVRALENFKFPYDWKNIQNAEL